MNGQRLQRFLQGSDLPLEEVLNGQKAACASWSFFCQVLQHLGVICQLWLPVWYEIITVVRADVASFESGGFCRQKDGSSERAWKDPSPLESSNWKQSDGEGVEANTIEEL